MKDVRINDIEKLKTLIKFDEEHLKENKNAYEVVLDIVINEGLAGLQGYFKDNFSKKKIDKLVGIYNENNKNLMNFIAEMKNKYPKLDLPNPIIQQLKDFFKFEKSVLEENENLYENLLDSISKEGEDGLLKLLKDLIGHKKAEIYLKKCKSEEEYPNLMKQLANPQKAELFQVNEENSILMKKSFLMLINENDKIPPEEFSVIKKETWNDINEALNIWIKENKKSKADNNNKSSIFRLMFPNIMSRLSSGEDFSTLCQHKLFTDDEDFPLYGFSEKHMLVFLLENFENFNSRLANSYSKIPGKPLPILYFCPIGKNPNFKINLKAYNRVLAVDRPYLISLGQPKIGKSQILNLLFFTSFEENNENLLHISADVAFSTEEFQLGMNIFDLQNDFLKYKDLFLCLLKIIARDAWIVVQISAESKEAIDYLKSTIKILTLEALIKPEQIIVFVKNWEKKNVSQEFESNLKSLISQKNRIFNILKFKDDGIFKSKLSELRRNLCQEIFGNAKERRKPLNMEIMDSNQNKYWILEENARIIPEISIDVFPENFKMFSMQIQKGLQIETSIFKKEKNKKIDLHSVFFKSMTMRRQFDKISKDFVYGLEYKQKSVKEKLKISDERKKIMDNLSHEMKNANAHELVLRYDELIRTNNVVLRTEFENILFNWQEPLIAPYLKQRLVLKKKNQELQSAIDLAESANKSLLEDNNFKSEEKSKLLDKYQLQEILNNIEKNKVQMLEINDTLEGVRVNKEHFWRELIQIYENIDQLENRMTFDKEEFYEGYAKYLKSGGDFEIIDGNNDKIHHISLQNAFNKIHKLTDQSNVFTISIIGPQSTGKSTLMNFLFNSNFQMSAGRCTQGLYGSIFKTNYKNANQCLVLDTEGLMSIERNDETFDRKLTIFAMALSHVMLINVNGEINESMKKIISLSMYAAQKLKLGTNKRPIIFFILRNMIDDDKNKQRDMIDKLEKEFEEVALCSNVKLTQILDYRHGDSFELMYSAYNKDEYFDNNSEKLFSFCLVNRSFRFQCEELRKKIFDEAANNKDVKPYTNLHFFLREAQVIWDTVTTYKDFFYLKNIKEIHDREKLTELYNELRAFHIENLDHSKSLKYILNKFSEGFKSDNSLKMEDIFKKIGDNCLSKKEEINQEFTEKTQSYTDKSLVKNI